MDAIPFSESLVFKWKTFFLIEVVSFTGNLEAICFSKNDFVYSKLLYLGEAIPFR